MNVTVRRISRHAHRTRLRPSDTRIAEVLLALAEQRGAGRTFCPSEAARALAEDWRPLMPEVRRVGSEIGLVATQRGKEVDAKTAKGPIRLSKRKLP
ncbi:DUF3253 domain-containing protein [Tropicimonas sp. S265A]|uniref:DUF3253 domain-containing protein n=1 Tax=Tropicimonas sp. S265A TaxID=3415134 RepID=UPI003C7DA7E0